MSFMTFNSILFDQQIIKNQEINQPECFTDLLLDQVVDAIVASKRDYNLKPFYYYPLQDINLIKFRTEIFKDLENQELLKTIQDFSLDFNTVPHGLNLVKYLEVPFNKMGWHLDVALIYCKSLMTISNDLSHFKLNSKGLTEFKEYIFDYINSENFKILYSKASEVKEQLQSIRYTINVQSGEFTVQKYEGEKEYDNEVLSLFERFRTHKEKKVELKQKFDKAINHIDSIILEFVARLFPEPFANLKQFCDKFPTYVDAKILQFDREIQFYISYLQFIDKIKAKDLKFCYPEITTSKEEIFNYNGFDLALALKFLENENQIIQNDFFLNEPERIIVFSGPNQGGKTTFARMFGQLHYLARLGVLLPGSKSKIFITDNIHTHFEKEESINTLQGKLMEELTRFKSIYSKLTPNSLLIMNEIFNSTTLDDAIFLGKEIMSKLINLGLFCIIVTFIDEISNIDPSFVSMVGNIDPANPEIRTFKITRRPADGLAYALAIAKKHQLTYSQIKERISF